MKKLTFYSRRVAVFLLLLALAVVATAGMGPSPDPAVPYIPATTQVVMVCTYEPMVPMPAQHDATAPFPGLERWSSHYGAISPALSPSWSPWDGYGATPLGSQSARLPPSELPLIRRCRPRVVIADRFG